MDLTWLEQFHIITYSEIDLSLIIHYLIYLTFSVNFPNQPFKSTYTINLSIKSATLLACDTSLPQTYVYKKMYSYLQGYIWFKWLTFLQITDLVCCGMYHSRALLGGCADKSPTKCS